jgi:hypothetical protein
MHAFDAAWESHIDNTLISYLCNNILCVFIGRFRLSHIMVVGNRSVMLRNSTIVVQVYKVLLAMVTSSGIVFQYRNKALPLWLMKDFINSY